MSPPGWATNLRGLTPDGLAAGTVAATIVRPGDQSADVLARLDRVEHALAEVRAQLRDVLARLPPPDDVGHHGSGGGGPPPSP